MLMSWEKITLIFKVKCFMLVLLLFSLYSLSIAYIYIYMVDGLVECSKLNKIRAVCCT